jgi:hypothetical protein
MLRTDVLYTILPHVYNGRKKNLDYFDAYSHVSCILTRIHHPIEMGRLLPNFFVNHRTQNRHLSFRTAPVLRSLSLLSPWFVVIDFLEK